MIQILTHRGLEPENKEFFTESSFEAFDSQIKRGFGLEFDVNFTSDGEIIIFHDGGSERITEGQDKRLFSQMNLSEVNKVKLANGRLCNLDELLKLLKSANVRLSALHLKGKFQEIKYLNVLLTHLRNHSYAIKKIIIFDVKIQTARYLKKQLPEVLLAPSVAHQHDIERYNDTVGGTLMSIDEALGHPELFHWVWLDEWDRTDRYGESKSLYNQEVFKRFRNQKFKIALVSPELHATSPNLLGGESHQDAPSIERLRQRIKEIIMLNPDAICTDYPNLVKSLTQ
jgi:glycerophosphoryl diester phosphodiesterase